MTLQDLLSKQRLELAVGHQNRLVVLQAGAGMSKQRTWAGAQTTHLCKVEVLLEGCVRGFSDCPAGA
jgi:hypothetical protein